MRKVLLTVLFLGWLFGPPSGVQKATEAFQAGKYAEAAAGYTAELENYHGQQPALNFNIAQSWAGLDSIAKASMFFGRVTNAGKEQPVLGSWAWNNIGCILGGEDKQGGAPGMMPGQAANPNQAQQGENQAGKMEQALQAFKDALKLDPDNDFARYNYELLKRKQKQQQDQQDQNQDQQDQEQKQDQQKQDQNQQKQQDQQNDSPQNQENKGNQNQQKPGEGENPQEMNAAEAARLLDAMNANEKKFLQQVEKGKKHKTYNHDGPDW